MASSTPQQIQVIFPQEGEAWVVLGTRLKETQGELLLILGQRELELVQQPDARKQFLGECKSIHQRLRIAAKHPTIAAEARGLGLRVIDRTKHLKSFLAQNPRLDEALRAFSPQLWRQQLKSQLQRMGLLSVPKLRIFSLVGLSIILFSIVVFRLLPSAEVHISPRQEVVSQTMNIFLVQSGSTADISDRVRQMPLLPISVFFQKSVTFDHISKEFIGERGNVPAGLRWDIPGLAPEERVLVYGENRAPATGGTTAYRTVLKQEDLEIAQKRLEQELLAAAKQMAEEQREEANLTDKSRHIVLLNYPELTTAVYSDFVLPTQFVDQVVTSVPIEGGVTYTVFSYDAQEILELLRGELQSHVREGRTLIDADLTYENLVAHVIDYSDDLSWIKLTVDLTATEEYILDSLSPTGALFAKKVREQVTGVSRDEALRIVKNMPEVESVRISQWPPWNNTLPAIASHISVISE